MAHKKEIPLESFDPKFYKTFKSSEYIELPIGGRGSILPRVHKALYNHQKLIEKLTLELETLPEGELKEHKKKFRDKIQNYLNILNRVIFDLKQYSKNIKYIIENIEHDHPNLNDMEITSSYMEPLLVALTPIIFNNHEVEYELNEQLSFNEIGGNSQVYDSHFYHDGSRFFSRMLFRKEEFLDPVNHKKGEARVKIELYDEEGGPKILAGRVDLSKDKDSDTYSVYFDFEFPNFRYIYRYLPRLSAEIVRKTQNCHSHHSFLLKLSKEEFKDFVDLCEYLISKDK